MDSVPHRNDVLVGPLLERNAALWPDEAFVTFEGGEAWTRQQALEKVYATANVLQARGIGSGDRVAIFAPNGAECIRTFWACAMIGAVAVPVNAAYRGHLLERLFEVTRPKLLVVDAGLADRIDEIGATIPRLLAGDVGAGEAVPPRLDRQVEIRDTQFLIMTSGTTGPSKCATVSFLHTFYGGAAFILHEGLNRDDTLLVDLPLFHMSAQYYSTACLATGTKLAIRVRPSLSNYWAIAQETGATCGILLSSMVPFLMRQPEGPLDRDHKLRTFIAAPLPADLGAFSARFGVKRVITMYGSTEVPACFLGDEVAGRGLGYVGEPQPQFEVRLVDGDDIEVPADATGELVVRADWPWLISAKYEGDPAATASAWRNGWFHTGDLFRREGNSYFFAGRGKDALRRRGEMVSAHEVEEVLASFPGVAEAACVAHPADTGVDDDVKGWLSLEAGQEIDFEALLRFCVARLPHFMVPRYFELTTEFPKTVTGRIQKFELRKLGNGAGAWDAIAAGFTVTRDGLSPSSKADRSA